MHINDHDKICFLLFQHMCLLLLFFLALLCLLGPLAGLGVVRMNVHSYSCWEGEIFLTNKYVSCSFVFVFRFSFSVWGSLMSDEWMLGFVKCIFGISWGNHVAFIPQTVNMMSYIPFQMLNQSFIPRINPT